MTDISEVRLLEVLGNFEKKILCEMKDVQMSVDNSVTIIGYRIDKLEKQIHASDFQWSALLNNQDIRIKKLESKLYALTKFLEVHLKIEVPHKSRSLNEYLEDVIK